MTLTVDDLECKPRFATPRRLDRPTLGGAVAKVAVKVGKPFMPWQQYVADVAFEINPRTGRLAYRTVVVTVPRQEGKTTLVLSVSVHRGLATPHFGPRQNMVYTAQTRKDARRKWAEDFVEDLKRAKPLAGHWTPKFTNGDEHIRFRNGSRFGIDATTEKSGHGGTLDLGFVDEAWSQPDNRVEQSFNPAMITRPQPQLWIPSTVGYLDEAPYLDEKIDHGRELAQSGVTTGTAYFEWSAPDDADPADRAVWWATMPALGHTITEDAVAAEFGNMGATEFRRAFLNQRVARDATDGWQLFDRTRWFDQTDSSTPAIGPRRYAVEMPPDRRATSVGAAGSRGESEAQVELVAHAPGTEWVVTRCVDLGIRLVVIDGRSAAASLIADFEKAGIAVEHTGAPEMAQASGRLYDGIVAGTVWHPGQPALTSAAQAAVKRPLGDAFAFDRRDPANDIGPLVAVALALHAHAGQPAVTPSLAWR